MFSIFFCLIVFVFGLIVGSFLNCVIYRLEIGSSFLRGKSFCPRCRHNLGFWDLIPVFSFIFLKGKCRYCQKPISVQYPLIELFTAIVFLLIFWQSPPLLTGAGPSPYEYGLGFSILNFSNLIYYWIIASFLIVIFVYDLKHYIIPDKIVYPAIIVALFYRFFKIWNFGYWNLFENWKLKIENLELLTLPMFSALGAAAFFLLIVLASRGRWMGVGDIKLAFLMGLILSWPNILVALFLAFFIGAIIGLGLIFFGKKTLKSEIPFGPFLIFGTFLALFSGSQIINWYQGLFLIY